MTNENAPVATGANPKAQESGAGVGNDNTPEPAGIPAEPLVAALKYAAAGWRVFPLAADTKIPRKGSRGYLDATTDESEICRWWPLRGGDDVAIACRPSGFIAIDVDEGDGKNGLAELAELERIWGPLPRDCVQRSGRGGLHILFRDPSPRPDGWTRVGGEISSKVKGQKSIDVKCNGYIRVEPSSDYSWLALPIVNGRPALPELPENWQALIRKPDERGPGDGVEAWAETVRALTDEQQRELGVYLLSLQRGRGGSSTFRAIKAIHHDWGLNVADGWPFLIGWNSRSGKPHTESELRRQLHRVADRELDGDRGWMLDWADDAAAVDALIAEREAESAPSDERVQAVLESLSRYRGREAGKLEIAGLARKARKGEQLDDKGASTLAAAVRAKCPDATDDQIGLLIAKSIGTVDRAVEIVAATPQRERPPAGEFKLGEDSKPKPSQQNIDVALAKLGVQLTYDRFADRAYLERAGLRAEISDKAVKALWLEIDQRFRFRPGLEFFRDVVENRAWLNGYHPVRDYLDSLVWDGVERLDSWLIDYCGAEGDETYIRAVGRLVLVAGVRRIRSPGCKFDELLILESEQGSGKSTLLSILAGRPEWFDDNLPLGAESKVVIEQTAGRWIIEVGELHQGRRGGRRSVEEIKAGLSRTVDRSRLAYGRITESRPRSFVAIGTSNGVALDDPTGDRRFWPVTVTEIDLAGLRRDRDQLWAEAAAAESAGEPIRMDPSLWKRAATAQESRRVDDPIADRIKAVIGDAEGWISSDDLWKLLELGGVQDQLRVGNARAAALKRLGFRGDIASRQWLPGRPRIYRRGDSEARLVPRASGSTFVLERHELVDGAWRPVA
jgi:hypothetical protein